MNLLGFADQPSLGVENQYFNTFFYDNITPDQRPFSWIVSASAIMATCTTILIGALSEQTRGPCFRMVWSRGGDFRSIHTNFKALDLEKPIRDRALLLSEFVEYALKLAHHLCNPHKSFGYKKIETKEALTAAYLDLLDKQLIPWIEDGLSGVVYTQTTDVEIELNGFLTDDREWIKMDLERIRNVSEKLLSITENDPS